MKEWIFESLFEDGFTPDFEIITDTKTFKVHRSILGDEFPPDTEDPSRTKVDLDAKTVKVMLRELYGLRVDCLQDHAAYSSVQLIFLTKLCSTNTNSLNHKATDRLLVAITRIIDTKDLLEYGVWMCTQTEIDVHAWDLLSIEFEEKYFQRLAAKMEEITENRELYEQLVGCEELMKYLLTHLAKSRC